MSELRSDEFHKQPILWYFQFLLKTHASLGEGCNYLVKESAIIKTDFVVNGFVAYRWDTLLGDLIQDARKFVNAPPPKNFLFALTKSCRVNPNQEPVGLLSALGYTNLINVTEVINSPEVNNRIEQGKM